MKRKTRLWAWIAGVVLAASERRGNSLKDFKDLYLKAKALTLLFVPSSLDSGWGLG